MAKVTVALDFGTTYSGFAYAHASEPAAVHSFYEYPGAAREKPYVKTPTASYYKLRAGGGQWEFTSWGHLARADYERDVLAFRKHRKQHPDDVASAPAVGRYLTKFKLRLAGADVGLPEGLTTEMVIADYLRAMGGVILTHLRRKFGAHLGVGMIQWCVTVPSIWDDAAKATMRACMAAAGLESGFPLIIVLEPEAASFYCHRAMSDGGLLAVGEKLLVVDIGGGTSDIVVQEVVSTDRLRVKEAATSTGALVGGADVDNRFMEYLFSVIGPCFAECLRSHQSVSTQLLATWERAKTSFDRDCNVDIDLPSALAATWERYEPHPERESGHDSIEITARDIHTIFDPVVEKILTLIAHQLVHADVKMLVVVGGFAGSPYLLERIGERFHDIPHIFSPPNPGSAVSCGAVALAMDPGMGVVSRICKRTYGFVVRAAFEEGVDPEEYKVTRKDGVARCRNRFLVLIRKGEEVKVDQAVSQTYNVFRDGKRTKVRLYSSDETHPRYTKGPGVKKEGKFYVWDVSGARAQQQRPEMKVSLFFGRACIEVKVEGINFVANDQVACQIPVDYLY